MQQGADFSPIGHWSQGLARVAQGLFGGMRERRADKESEANAAESNAVLQALMGQQSGATGTAGAGNAPAPNPRAARTAARNITCNRPADGKVSSVRGDLSGRATLNKK